MAKKQTVLQINVRLPVDLKKKIQQDAEKRGVSFNHVLVKRLEASFAATGGNELLKDTVMHLAQLTGHPEIASKLKGADIDE